jgi:hypothetical protein
MLSLCIKLVSRNFEVQSYTWSVDTVDLPYRHASGKFSVRPIVADN